LGALLFNSIAIVANSKICTVAPLAYQNGPDTPYLYAMADDCRRVAWKLVFSQMGVVSGGDIVLGENHKTGQNRKCGFPQHLPEIPIFGHMMEGAFFDSDLFGI